MRTECESNRALADTLTDREALRAKFSSIKPAPTRARPGILLQLLRLLRR